MTGPRRPRAQPRAGIPKFRKSRKFKLNNRKSRKMLLLSLNFRLLRQKAGNPGLAKMAKFSHFCQIRQIGPRNNTFLAKMAKMAHFCPSWPLPKMAKMTHFDHFCQIGPKSNTLRPKMTKMTIFDLAAKPDQSPVKVGFLSAFPGKSRLLPRKSRKNGQKQHMCCFLRKTQHVLFSGPFP